MQPGSTYSPNDRHLRFVFDDAVIFLNLAPDATFGDVARECADLALHHRGHPIAIDITLPARPGLLGARCAAPETGGLSLSV
ncbi:MAG: hypothetical protein WCC64_23265 [Aliidongia sp.]